MNKTKIEWVKNPDGSQGYTWNPITGCLNHTNGLCKGGGFPCYAYKLAQRRLKNMYLKNENVATSQWHNFIEWRQPLSDPFYPRFWLNRVREDFGAWSNGAIPKGIFVCDMGDLFGQGVPEEWTRRVLNHIGMSYYKEHRFYLLTKQPQNLIKWSPFPDNCWVGVTACNWLMFSDALGHLASIHAKVKYISFEPLLGEIKLDMMQEMLFPRVIDWLIIGAQTKPYKPPKVEWVQEIALSATKAHIPIFIKDNLKPVLPNRMPFWCPVSWTVYDKGVPIKMGENRLRQEVPSAREATANHN